MTFGPGGGMYGGRMEVSGDLRIEISNLVDGVSSREGIRMTLAKQVELTS